MCFLQLSLLIAHLYTLLRLTNGVQFCQESSDCFMRVGTTCQNSQCICAPSPENSLYPRSCPQERNYGEVCTSDADCPAELICDKSDLRVCRCRGGRVWDIVSKKCYEIDEPFVGKRYDITRDVIIPSIVLATLAITASLCYSYHKSWRRRRRGAEMSRALEEAQLPYVGTSQPTWIASCRVFGTVERAGPPFLLLPVGPPTYEEALKHKVILSSYQPAATVHMEQTPL